MWRTLCLEVVVLASIAAACAEARPLVVISVDGLDYRYLRDADTLGLKIPHMRRMIEQGALAQGVVGVVPTITSAPPVGSSRTEAVSWASGAY